MATENETLKKDVQELRTSLEKLTKDVSTISQSLAEDAKARAGKAASEIKDSAGAIASEISAKGRQSAEAVEETVRERPLQSLLIAFGTGLVLAQILRKH